MASLGDWVWGDPYASMMQEARADNQARYGTNEDQPPLRSVSDPTPYKAFHDDKQAYFSGPTAYSGGYALGGGASLASRR